ncbi:RNA:NAD 2'-phosphotransferase (TPT1/KptA family) [Arthrobacter pascens]|nr:RNA:NAD 2'-phosphotransferase (TPT1/KptA family) [Arthrobacter pascens]
MTDPSAGTNFYRGSDVVWLADLIPTEFIRILETG